MLGLCCYVLFSLAVVTRGYSLLVVHGLLIAVACLVVEHGLHGVLASLVVARVLSSCRFQALKHRLNSCQHRLSVNTGSTACEILLDQGSNPGLLH